jgi:nanoRNase/pAp phosphatase (c-di-AMP/oligoRNAs hydrolase)
MMVAVDKSDSAQFTRQEILDPKDWVLLNYLMDSRTGLGRFREFRVSNYQLMMDLIAYCRNHGIDDILALPDVKERVDLYFEHAEKAKEQIKRCTRCTRTSRARPAQRRNHLRRQPLHDLRAVPRGQHLHPRHVGRAEAEHRVRHRQVDHQPQSNTNIGELMLFYGGGGHENAGTCQIDNDKADAVLQELTKKINADG